MVCMTQTNEQRNKVLVFILSLVTCQWLSIDQCVAEIYCWQVTVWGRNQQAPAYSEVTPLMGDISHLLTTVTSRVTQLYRPPWWAGCSFFILVYSCTPGVEQNPERGCQVFHHTQTNTCYTSYFTRQVEATRFTSMTKRQWYSISLPVINIIWSFYCSKALKITNLTLW